MGGWRKDGGGKGRGLGGNSQRLDSLMVGGIGRKEEANFNTMIK